MSRKLKVQNKLSLPLKYRDINLLTRVIISYFPGNIFLLIPSILYQKQPSSIALSQAEHNFISNCKNTFLLKAFAKHLVHYVFSNQTCFSGFEAIEI